MGQDRLEAPPDSESQGFRILLVEDNPDHRLLESKSLEALGDDTEVVAVGDPGEAVRLLHEQHFDLAIADYQMPGMDGLSFIRTLGDQGLDVPIVMVTGVGGEGTAVEALKLGAQDYVLKDLGYLDLLPSIAARAIASFRSKKHLQETRRQLAESEQRYRDLVHGVDAIVWEADPTTWEFSFVSERAESILGYPLGRWLERPKFWTEILHPEDRQRAIAARRQATRSHSDYEFTYRVVALDGTTVWLRDKVRLARREQGGGSLRGFMIDITDQKRAEAEAERLQRQLRQSQKLESIGTLVGGIAHGFNNLLQGILGYACLAQNEVEKGTYLHGFLDSIVESAHRAAELTAQLLTFGRPRDPNVGPVQLNQLMDETLRMLRPMIPTTIEIEVSKSPEPATIEADSSQLQQVLLNLCVNARDAMPDGGRLLLATETVDITRAGFERGLKAQEGRYVVLTVTDNGEGMTESVKERIFDPFFTSKEVGQGTGLGLAVVYGVIRSHRGWIEVESEPGRGTAFRIYLPALAALAGEEEGVTEKPEEAAGGAVGGDETILIVDDEPVVLNLACRILEHYGYRTLTAEDGSEAVSVFETLRGRIDLVVLDLTMPKLSGLECGRRMRRMDPSIPLIVSSGQGTEVDLDGEILSSVPKPYSPVNLARTVRAVLDSEASATVPAKR